MVGHDVGNAVGDLLLGDLGNFVHIVPGDLKGIAVIQTDAAQEAVRQSGFLGHFNGMTHLQAFDHDGSSLLGDADDLDIRQSHLHTERYTGDESAAGEGDKDRIHLGQILHDLQGHRGLPADDLLVIEGRDHGDALFPFHFIAVDTCIILRVPVLQNLGSPACDVLYFYLRNMAGHTDDRRNAQLAGDIGDGSAVVSGGEGGDTGLPGFFRETEDLVGCPPDLESTNLLKVLQLEINVGPGHLAESMGVHQWGLGDIGSDAGTGNPDVSCSDILNFHIFLLFLESCGVSAPPADLPAARKGRRVYFASMAAISSRSLSRMAWPSAPTVVPYTA